MQAGYIMFSTSMMIIFSFGLLFGAYSMMSAFRKMFVRTRLKKYDLNDYDIVCTAKGFPSLLINKKNRNIIVYL